MTEFVLRRANLAFAHLRRLDPVWILVAVLPLVILALDPDRAGSVLAFSLDAFIGTLPFISLAVVLIGVLKATGAEGVLADAFTGRESRMIVLAAILGGLAPFCSCEVIPFIAALLAAGTPLSAVMAFWLASPVMDPPQFMITLGALGLEFAIAKVIFAVCLGLLGGFVMQALVTQGAFAEPLRPRKTCGTGCDTGCGAGVMDKKPVWKFWPHAQRRMAFRAAAVENAVFLTKWLSLAYILESL
ncbi:MAG: permease, partial [Pseudomonadota bacterium]